MRAADKSQRIRRPINTTALARAGLAVDHEREVWVRSLVPPLPPHMLRRLPQSMQRAESAERPDGDVRSTDAGARNRPSSAGITGERPTTIG
jgi:hypothetical protein